uniref:Uncharacterized protein n=1 Tax=Nelumbo nucifera TaxID=4432 RepID=A0A823A0X3_NELNU|nr:TPA_asm: hypothetical protein HUJ06_018613 [Nelumbo nucifera]
MVQVTRWISAREELEGVYFHMLPGCSKFCTTKKTNNSAQIPPNEWNIKWSLMNAPLATWILGGCLVPFEMVWAISWTYLRSIGEGNSLRAEVLSLLQGLKLAHSGWCELVVEEHCQVVRKWMSARRKGQ